MKQQINKEFVLSDSSVNCYGFRLLTSGYQIEEYARNPIGYYMHNREEGVLVRWENLSVNGDKITAFPAINMSNKRGQQTVDEIESGFLRAASVGGIVVLDYSTDSSLMLPGQTGPTITKWYNTECSIVDVPGNSNALTLYNAGRSVITLASLSKPITSQPPTRPAPPPAPPQEQKEVFPPELYYTLEKFFTPECAGNVKHENYTLFAAMMWHHYGQERPELAYRHLVDMKKLEAYKTEIKRNRVAELKAMGCDKLWRAGLLEELKKLDALAFAQVMSKM